MEIKEHNVHSNLRNKEVLEPFWADCNKPSRNRESLNFSQHIRIMRSVPFLMKFISDISVCKIQQKHKKVLHTESHKLPKSSGNGKLHLIGCYRNTGTTCRTFTVSISPNLHGNQSCHEKSTPTLRGGKC